MDEKTKLLVCLGAATAANCIPCFEFYYGKALAAGVAAADMQEVVEIAYQVKNNINMLMKKSIRATTGLEGDGCPSPIDTCSPKCGS